MTQFETTYLWFYAVGTVVAIGLLIVAVYQLRRAAQAVERATEANQLSTLNTVLSLDATISERRIRLSEASVAISELARKAKDDPTPPKEGEFKVAQLRFEEARESYLNAMDRLCACILRGFLPEDDCRRDYRGGINDTVQGHKDLLGPGTRYRNILKVHEKWADE
jgi:hypothetical protein